MRLRLSSLLLGAALTILVPLAAFADRADQDAVRHAVERGEIRPLADILAQVRDRLPGEVVGVEIDEKKGRWLYEFRVVAQDGRLFEVYVNARTGEIERTREK